MYLLLLAFLVVLVNVFVGVEMVQRRIYLDPHFLAPLIKSVSLGKS
jgi:hypothetical protein